MSSRSTFISTAQALYQARMTSAHPLGVDDASREIASMFATKTLAFDRQLFLRNAGVPATIRYPLPKDDRP